MTQKPSEKSGSRIPAALPESAQTLYQTEYDAARNREKLSKDYRETHDNDKSLHEIAHDAAMFKVKRAFEQDEFGVWQRRGKAGD